MGMKIQAFQVDNGLPLVEVGKTYYIEDTGNEVYGEFKVTHLEVIAAPTASGVEVRADIEIENPVTESCKYYDISIDAIIADAS